MSHSVLQGGGQNGAAEDGAVAGMGTLDFLSPAQPLPGSGKLTVRDYFGLLPQQSGATTTVRVSPFKPGNSVNSAAISGGITSGRLRLTPSL